jgi:hypothetical protein
MNTSIYIKPSLLQQVKSQADIEGRSISNMISQLVTQALAKSDTSLSTPTHKHGSFAGQ